MGNKPGQEIDGRPITRARPATVASVSPSPTSPAVTESDFLRIKGADEIPKKEDFLSVKADPRAKEHETARKRSDEISSALALGFAQVDTNRDGFIQPAKVLHIYREVCALAEAVHSPPKFRSNDKVRFLQWDTLFKNIPTTDKRLNKALKQIDFSSYKDFQKNGKISSPSSPPAYIDNSTTLGSFVAPTASRKQRASMINLPTKAPGPLPTALTVPSPTIPAPTSQPTSPTSPVSFVGFDSSSSTGSTGTTTSSSTIPPQSPVSPSEDASPVYIRKSSTGGLVPATAPTTASSTISPLVVSSGISPPVTTKPAQKKPSRKQSESKSKRTARQKSRKQSRPRSSTGDSDISVASSVADSELDLEFDVNLNIDKVDADLTAKRDGLKSDDEDDEDHSSIIARANAAWSAK